jgi:hypothetical protein
MLRSTVKQAFKPSLVGLGDAVRLKVWALVAVN